MTQFELSRCRTHQSRRGTRLSSAPPFHRPTPVVDTLQLILYALDARRLFEQSPGSELSILDTQSSSGAPIRVLVLHFRGDSEAFANALAEGVRDGGADAAVMQIPERGKSSTGAALIGQRRSTRVLSSAELDGYDAIVIGVPTRFGLRIAQLDRLLAAIGDPWTSGVHEDQLASLFTLDECCHNCETPMALDSMLMILPHRTISVGSPRGEGARTALDSEAGPFQFSTASILPVLRYGHSGANNLELARRHGRHVAKAAVRQRALLGEC